MMRAGGWGPTRTQVRFCLRPITAGGAAGRGPGLRISRPPSRTTVVGAQSCFQAGVPRGLSMCRAASWGGQGVSRRPVSAGSVTIPSAFGSPEAASVHTSGSPRRDCRRRGGGRLLLDRASHERSVGECLTRSLAKHAVEQHLILDVLLRAARSAEQASSPSVVRPQWRESKRFWASNHHVAGSVALGSEVGGPGAGGAMAAGKPATAGGASVLGIAQGQLCQLPERAETTAHAEGGRCRPTHRT